MAALQRGKTRHVLEKSDVWAERLYKLHRLDDKRGPAVIPAMAVLAAKWLARRAYDQQIYRADCAEFWVRAWVNSDYIVADQPRPVVVELIGPTGNRIIVHGYTHPIAESSKRSADGPATAKQVYGGARSRSCLTLVQNRCARREGGNCSISRRPKPAQRWHRRKYGREAEFGQAYRRGKSCAQTCSR